METKLSPCQCCLKKSQKLSNVNFVSYLRMIQDCFAIEVPLELCIDGSEPIVCKECINTLAICHRFMMTIRESQFTLQMTRSTVKSTIHSPKPEHWEDDDDPDALGEFFPPSPPSGIENIEIPKETQENTKTEQRQTTTSFTCKMCQKTFQFRENYEFHIKHHAQYTAGRLECDKCSKKFTHMRSLAFHERTHRVLDAGCDYTCATCGEEFHTKEFYRQHLKRHPVVAPEGKVPRVNKRPADEDVPRECQLCGKAVLAVRYSMHMRIHAGLAPHRCRRCPERFMHIDAKYRHMRDAHGMIIDRLMCDRCPKKFHRRGLLNKHMRDVHDQPAAVIQCKLCSYKCNRSDRLKMHMYSHTSVKDVICHVCGKAFVAKKYLTQHQKLHYNYKALVCDHCGEGFTQRISLTTHLKKAHSMLF